MTDKGLEATAPQSPVVKARRLTSAERQILRQRIDAARREATAVQPIGEGERRCFGCGAVKLLSAFSKSKRHTAGRSYQCLACKSDYERARKARLRGDL